MYFDDNDDQPNKFEIYVNKIRSQLLLLSDKEMHNKLKHPTTQINSENPRIIDFSKENNFYMHIEQKFCSSRVNYNEDNLKNAYVKFIPKHHKKRSTFGNFSSKYITRIPYVNIGLNNFSAHHNQIKSSIIHKSNKTFKNDSTNKNGLQGNIPLITQCPESPSIKKFMKKKNITKKSIFKDEKISRNSIGAYIEDPEVYLRIKESFSYIRSLPYLKTKIDKIQTPKEKIKEKCKLSREFKEFEESLLIRDVPEKYEDIANTKMKKTKDRAATILKKNGKKKSLKVIFPLRNLSPVNRKLDRQKSSSDLFLLDLRSAYDINYNFTQELDVNNDIEDENEIRRYFSQKPKTIKSFHSLNKSFCSENPKSMRSLNSLHKSFSSENLPSVDNNINELDTIKLNASIEKNPGKKNYIEDIFDEEEI